MNRFGITAALLASAMAFGQEGSKVAVSLGGGFTQTVGNTGRHLDDGWNVNGGIGFKFHPRVGVMADFGFNNFGINSPTLANLGFPDGTVRVFSATLDPIVHIAPRGPVDVYLVGGGGLYHRTQEFTQPTVVTSVGFDPFFGFYQFAASANQVLSTYSVNKPGVNGGLGVAIGSRWHAKFFAEARYHRILMGNGNHTDFVPVTVGIRW
jgi:hypothetical protein